MAQGLDAPTLAQQYRAANKGYLPDRVRRSGRRQRRKAAKALGDGCGWLARLQMLGDNLGFHTIALRDLGLEHLEHESDLYNHESVAAIKQVVCRAMPDAFAAKLEVGNDERKIHVHILAHVAPTVKHHTSVVYDLKGIITYWYKPSVPSDDQSANVYLTAKNASRAQGDKSLPRIAFRRGIPNR